MIGLLSAAALLLAAAGLAKLRQRAPVRSAFAAAAIPGARRLPAGLANRLSGMVELAIAATVLGVAGRLGGVLIALGYGLLAALSARMTAIEFGQDCGCFHRPSPVTHWHTGVNLAGALIGVLAVLLPARPLPAELSLHPVSGAALLLASAVLAYLGYLTMTALPALRAAATELEMVR